MSDSNTRDIARLSERLAAVETSIEHLKTEAGAVRSALHNLISTEMVNNTAAIRSLATARDFNYGAWWAAGAGISVALALIGLAGWLLTQNVSIRFG